MTKANSLDPPKLAAWLMEQFSPVLKNAPLAGDLMEAFKQGGSSAWYWRQVFWAVLIGLLNLFRKRWGRLAYAVVCSGLIATTWFFMFPGGVTIRETALFDGERRILLRALTVTVSVLASSNLALTFLRVTPSVVSDASLVAWCVLVSTPAIFALLLGMWQANLADDTSRPIST
jgi:hypothetical protein